MRCIKAENAIGTILAHDLTRIIPGEFKGPAFKKGHIIQSEDIPLLKEMGKHHITILDIPRGWLHEDEAARRIAQAAGGENVYLCSPTEGKVTLRAAIPGLLKINRSALNRINDISQVILVTAHNNTMICQDQMAASSKIIPLTIKEKSIAKVEAVCQQYGPVINVSELQSLPVGIVVTGTEIFQGAIADRFGPILIDKAAQYGCSLLDVIFTPDDTLIIQEAICCLLNKGAKLVMISGGMSVDADDVTPHAITKIADHVVSYGAPVLPGAMFMLAYKDDNVLMGIPACGMYHRTTVLDLILPRILTGECITRRDINSLAHGGLCRGCETCYYPNCSFGK